MNFRTQVIMYVLCATATENIETLPISSVMDLLSEISDTMQNLWWFVAFISTILVLVFSLFSIRRKANKYTRKVINRLIDDGKYIPGVFVELNDTKEVLRYFVYSKKWKKRLIEGFNFVYDNAYGDILRKACDNTSACFHLGRGTSQKDVMDAVNTAYDLHNNFRFFIIRFKLYF